MQNQRVKNTVAVAVKKKEVIYFMANIEILIKQLPLDLQDEVKDFIEFLLQKKQVRKTKKKLRQDWANALKQYRGQYTSLELQKKALEWRGD